MFSHSISSFQRLSLQGFVRSVLEPMPSTIPLLTMIRLTEEVVTEIQKRRCSPAENFIFSVRLQMWPIFQKAMHEHVESLKRVAEGTSTGYFSRASPITDATVAKVCHTAIQEVYRLKPSSSGLAKLRQLLQLVRLLDGARRRDDDFCQVCST